MAASKTTTYYNLPIYQPDDLTSWLTDFNGAMNKLDSVLHDFAEEIGTEIEIEQTTGQSTTAVMSQKGTTDAIEATTTALNGTINGLQENLTTQITNTNNSVTALNTTVTGLQTSVNGKQNTLVSGTNIKTINGSSILGSGDLSVGTKSSYIVPTQIWVDENLNANTSIPLTSQLYLTKNKTYLILASAEMSVPSGSDVSISIEFIDGSTGSKLSEHELESGLNREAHTLMAIVSPTATTSTIVLGLNNNNRTSGTTFSAREIFITAIEIGA